MVSITVISKPTHDCNLRCKYCYVEESAENGRMSGGLLALSIEKVSDFFDDSHWIWHGGEPLLMGIDFFRVVQNVQEFYRKSGKRFSNGIQTNGTLITNDLLKFIEETKDFHIGMSIDGPEEIHNKTRVYGDGRGSFEDVMLGFDLTKRNGRTGSGVICVVSAKNVGYPEELYHFFKTERINIKFNPLIKSGRAKENFNDLGITPKQYGNFLLKLWNIYNEDVMKDGKVVINIDPFMEVIGNIETGKPLGCNYSSSCRDNFISIGPKGDIYPCGRFDGIFEFWMGNIKTNTIEEAINSEINQSLKKRSLETVTGCSNCDSSQICNSGCMHNAYFAGDVFGKDPYCSSYKMLFKKMKGVLEAEKAKLGGKNG